MEPPWLPFGVNKMPTTLTLENIPDAVYERLKTAAEIHRRSLNSEAIVEAVLMPTKMAPSERLARARELRAALSKRNFPADDIDASKREGRPQLLLTPTCWRNCTCRANTRPPRKPCRSEIQTGPRRFFGGANSETFWPGTYGAKIFHLNKR
jgi:hypothetical protein